ncbi:MAG: DUF401 family protein, partial [candidate division Zixibacteria bacterium]|nr:DUF401 family protein [candidate division Zixibacteria bacterium]
IVGMFLYLHIFEVSEARAAIAAIPLPLLTLSVGAGFLLGFLTGRIQLPGSIVLPVYMATAGGISFPVFALIYFGIYYGYVTSPVHPCLVVTCEYFGVTIRRMLLLLLWPTIIIFVLIIILSYVMQ